MLHRKTLPWGRRGDLPTDYCRKGVTVPQKRCGTLADPTLLTGIDQSVDIWLKRQGTRSESGMTTWSTKVTLRFQHHRLLKGQFKPWPGKKKRWYESTSKRCRRGAFLESTGEMQKGPLKRRVFPVTSRHQGIRMSA